MCSGFGENQHKKCEIRCQKVEDLIRCSCCTCLFHPECTKFGNLNEFANLPEEMKISWKCDECVIESVSTASTSGSDPLDAIKDLDKKMEKLLQMGEQLAVKIEENNIFLRKLQDTVNEIKGCIFYLEKH